MFEMIDVAASVPAALATASAGTASAVRWGTIAVLTVLTAISWSRHPVPMTELRRRLPRCLLGLAMFGVGISFFFAGHLGTGPWDVLHAGLAKRTGLGVGIIINLLGLALLPLWIPLKERVGLGTVLNALEIGVVLDLVSPHLPVAHHLAARVAYVVSGLVIVAIATGLYIGSGLGAGPRDGLMLGLKRLGLSVRVARTLVEIVTVVLGLVLGGKVGVGTVIFLGGIGPLVQFFLHRLMLPPLAPPAAGPAAAR